MKMFSKDSIKMPKDAGWLMPGLQVKRWFAMIFLGSLLIALGTMIVFNMRPIFFTMEFIRYIAANAPSGIVGLFVAVIGAAIFFKGWQKTNYSMLDLSTVRDKGQVFSTLIESPPTSQVHTLYLHPAPANNKYRRVCPGE